MRRNIFAASTHDERPIDRVGAQTGTGKVGNQVEVLLSRTRWLTRAVAMVDGKAARVTEAAQ